MERIMWHFHGYSRWEHSFRFCTCVTRSYPSFCLNIFGHSPHVWLLKFIFPCQKMVTAIWYFHTVFCSRVKVSCLQKCDRLSCYTAWVACFMISWNSEFFNTVAHGQTRTQGRMKLLGCFEAVQSSAALHPVVLLAHVPPESHPFKCCPQLEVIGVMWWCYWNYFQLRVIHKSCKRAACKNMKG